jgi:energy-coupling factor transporter ATP-binding protein EcfA2
MGYRLLDAIKILGENPDDPIARQRVTMYLALKRFNQALKRNDFKRFVDNLLKEAKVKE